MTSKYVTKTFTYDGKRYYVRAKTEAEAIEKMVLKKLELKECDMIFEPSAITVREWATKCIDTYKTNLSDKALRTCKDIVRLYITDTIGNMKLKNVKQIHCQQVMNNVAGYSQYVINQTYQKMVWIFRKAVENGMLENNPALYVSKPKGYKNSRRALTKEEQEVFLKCAKKHPKGLLFLMMYGCSCRPTEASNVKMQDFFEKDGKTFLHIKGTKSETADRIVPVPQYIAELLPNNTADEYVVTSLKGNHLNEKAMRRAWLSLKRMMDIEMGAKLYRNHIVESVIADDISPYCLRHTYCSNLQNKVDIRVAQRLMGHSDITLTANIYTHSSFDLIEDAWEKING
jgi:integrase